MMEPIATSIVRWVEGAPREALVGQTIAAIAGPGQYGVDGQAAGAFEKRSPVRDARFRVPGEGAAAGDWRISGDRSSRFARRSRGPSSASRDHLRRK